MPAISYSIGLGGNLQTITAGANAPSAGSGTIELRIDQTASAIIDNNAPGGTRAVKRGEVQVLLRVLEEYLLADTNLNQ